MWENISFTIPLYIGDIIETQTSLYVQVVEGGINRRSWL